MEHVGIATIKERISVEFEHLPPYASFILHNEMEDFVRELMFLYSEADLPVLRFFKSMSDDQLEALVTGSTREMLTLVAAGEVSEYINQSINNWLNNQLPQINREQIHSQDIALANYTRARVFRKFISRYTSDHNLWMSLVEELDRFRVILDSELFACYTQLQQQEINKVNAALQRREQQLLEAQEVGQVGSFEWDLIGKRSSYTPKMLEIFEMEQAASLADFLQDVHPEERGKVRQAIQESFVTGNYECEYRYVKNGREKFILSRGKVQFHNGEPARLVGTVTDVTERHEIIRKLETANNELIRTNEELESFNFIASHDLQEPLRKIQVYSNRILEGSDELSPSFHDYFLRINKASKRMQKLIGDFLLFSHTFKVVQLPEEVELNPVLDEIIAELSTRIEEKRAVIHVAPLPTVYAVPFQVKQLLINLISNALKYTYADVAPEIFIMGRVVGGSEVAAEGADPQKRYTLISVTDNGIGFERKYTTKIFELFQRLHSKDAYSGTGIGLALCRKIVKNLNGFITADSEPGKGSVFTVYIPVKADTGA